MITPRCTLPVVRKLISSALLGRGHLPLLALLPRRSCSNTQSRTTEFSRRLQMPRNGFLLSSAGALLHRGSRTCPANSPFAHRPCKLAQLVALFPSSFQVLLLLHRLLIVRVVEVADSLVDRLRFLTGIRLREILERKATA